MSMQVRAQGGSVRMDAILLREGRSYVMYMRSPLLKAQLPRGKSWVRLDLSKATANVGVDFSALVSTSQTVAPFEHGLVSTTRKGRATVAGAQTTRYRVVVDMRRVGRAIPSYAKQLAMLERTTGIRLGRIPYDIWIDDRRIRRVTYATPAPGGKTVQTITFLSFDEPVTISAPPRSQVVTP
jgi:hypothetical protein